ncbi:MAG: hypothetical protein K2P53_05150 [Rickettsiales bacterium]|nr:hypothetical protein [Rickettsiales bacterium]
MIVILKIIDAFKSGQPISYLQLMLDNKIIDAFIPGQKYFIFSFIPGQKIATIAEFCFY